ncbi:MAG: glycosyltransferase family 39 protein [Candidatus Eisenbacteria bacterium]|nr:glycosyltransferase family 39 protein [Candidatus Eisenbacteria bacterium]
MTTPTPRPMLQKDPLAISALLFVAFWGFVALAFRPIGDFGVETDFYGDFAVYAREWAAGHPTLMNGFRGPLYYVLLAAFSKVVPDLFMVAKILSVISAGAALWFTSDLIRRIWGGSAGLVALLLMASSPTFIDYSYRACNDLVFLALVTGSLNLLFRTEGAVVRGFAIAGALGGMAWMTRYNGSVLLPAALIAAVLLFGRTRRTIVVAGSYIGGWILVGLPWLLFVQSRTGTPLWNKAYENIAIEVLSDDANRAQSTGFMSATNISSLKDVWDVDPGLFLSVMFGNTWDHLRDDALKLVGIPWAIVAMAGLLLGWASWRNRRALAFLATGLLTYLSLLPVFYNERFMLPLLPMWGATAGGVAWWLEQRVTSAPAPRKKSSRGSTSMASRLRLTLFGALGVLTLVQTVMGYRLAVDPRRFGGMPGEYVALYHEARIRGVPFGPTKPIAARKPHFPYLVGSPTVGVPTGSLEHLRGSGAHYLLISGSEVAIYPSLASIWMTDKPEDIPTGLRLAARSTWQRSNGEMTGATLYALENPKPWTPRESSPFKLEKEIPKGYARIDFLRLQLAEWLLRSGALRDPDTFFRRMSPASLELTRSRLARATAAIRRSQLADAERLYRDVLLAEPTNRSARLGLAAVAHLGGRSAAHAEAVRQAFGTAPGEWPSLEALQRESEERLRLMEAPQSLAAAAAGLARQPDADWAHKASAYSLQSLFHPNEARAHVESVLKRLPDDQEARAMLKTLVDDRRGAPSPR